MSSSRGAGSMAADSCVRGDLPSHLVLAASAGRFAADVVGHAPERDLRQPRPRIARQTIAGPFDRRGQECLLNGILGFGEIAESSHDCAEDLRR